MTDMHVAATGGFAIDALVDVDPTALNVDLTITSGNNTVRLLVDITETDVTVEVYYNGVLVAEGFEDENGDFVLTGAGGRELSDAEIDALEDIFEQAGEVFGHMIDLIDAVFLVFV
jgi:hypothetical protein